MLSLLSSESTYLGVPGLLQLANGQETVLELHLEAIDDHVVGRSDQKDSNLGVLISSVKGHIDSDFYEK